jgi:tripartite-type tricarboxylate transporter receptor subunit TctC
VKIVVPFPAGGATDVVARLLAQKLAEAWGQSMVVENRAGAGGNIGADVVAKSAPDGYTLLMTSGSIVTANPYMYKSMTFDAAKDLVAITNVATGPQVIAVSADVPAKDLRELIAYAKANPGKINFGSAGVGTQTHLAAENFAYAAGIDMTHVPYKGEPQAVTDIVGGRVQLLWATPTTGLAHVKDGKLRALATNLKARSSLLPDVPTMTEVGVPQYSIVSWAALYAPGKMPRELQQRLNKEFTDALKRPDVVAQLEKQAFQITGSTPEELGAFTKSQLEAYRAIMKSVGMQPE